MFATIKFAEKPKGVSERLKRKFGKKQVTAERVAVAPGVFYFSLFCNFTAEKADWNIISASAGNLRNRLILPEGVFLPKNSGCRLSVCESLKKTTFILSVYDILKVKGCKAIAFYDDGGFFPEDILRFVPLAPAVRVLTDSPEKYENVREKIMEKYGASLIVSPKNVPLYHTALISYSGGVYKGEGIEAFTAADTLFGASKLMRLKELTFSEEILTVVPEGVKADAFIAALFEYSHFQLPKNSVFPLWEGLGA